MRCNKPITLKDRNGQGFEPYLSYQCELPIDDGPHEGPCASPSLIASVNARKEWEVQDAKVRALRRHAESGMAMSQSLPMTSEAITTPGTQRPHSSAPTSCPFCDEQPMVKEFIAHVQTHQSDQEPAVVQPKVIQTEEAQAVPPEATWDEIVTAHAIHLLGTWLRRVDAPEEVMDAYKRLAVGTD